MIDPLNNDRKHIFPVLMVIVRYRFDCIILFIYVAMDININEEHDIFVIISNCLRPSLIFCPSRFRLHTYMSGLLSRILRLISEDDEIKSSFERLRDANRKYLQMLLIQFIVLFFSNKIEMYFYSQNM